MKLSTRTRYGMLVMMELAEAGPEQTTSVRVTAEKRGLSEKYLEQILAVLKSAGLVVSFRGFGGGYTLPKPPARISVGDVFRVLEGPPALVDCVDVSDECARRDTCAIRQTWIDMADAMTHVMDTTSLRDLLDREVSRSRSRSAHVT